MQKKIRVVDIPDETSAEEAEKLLNGPCEQGYYLFRLSTATSTGTALRAIFQLRAKPE